MAPANGHSGPIRPTSQPETPPCNGCPASCHAQRPLRPMIGLLQRVSEARVEVGERLTGAIGNGLLVLVGVERGDREAQADRLLERLLTYRVFPDEQGRMNRSLVDVGGGLLLVSQFTLAADTRKGTRPGFTPAADPPEGRRLFDYLVAKARTAHPVVQTGEFGAHMKVALTNEGPVTFWLQVAPGEPL